MALRTATALYDAFAATVVQDGALFLFDSATPSAATASAPAAGHTYHIETRSGAGASLPGYMAQLGKSASPAVAILSPSSLLAAAPALASLPPVTQRAP